MVTRSAGMLNAGGETNTNLKLVLLPKNDNNVLNAQYTHIINHQPDKMVSAFSWLIAST